MSTRSNIGYWMKNGRIRHIWCRDDGYPEDIGATLYQYYNTWQKVKELIDGGDISALGAEIGEKHEFDDSWDSKKEGKDWTHFYKRDRGLGERGAIVSRDEDSYAEKAKDSSAEYAYLFDPGENNWQVLDLNHEEKGWRDLEKVLGKGGIKDKDFEEVHGEGSPYPEHGDLEEIHGKGNPYESKQKDKNKTDLQEGQMLTKEDISKYATPEELNILKEDEEPRELTTDEKIEEEDKAIARRVVTKMFNDILSAKTAYENDLPKDAEYENMDIHSNILHIMDAVVTLKDKLEGE